RGTETVVRVAHILVIHTGGDRVIADVVAQVDAQGRVGRLVLRVVHAGRRVLVCDTAPVAPGVIRILVRWGDDVRGLRLRNLAVVRAMHLAVQDRQGQVVGDVARELGGVQIRAALVERHTGGVLADQGAALQRRVVEVIDVGVVVRLVRRTGD